MINQDIIDEVRNRLVKTYDPLAIYIFGSYAWGTPNEDSDLDLLVIVEASDEKSFKRPIPGHRALVELCISKDLIVYTRDEFDRYSIDPTSLCHVIQKRGKLLYAKA